MTEDDLLSIEKASKPFSTESVTPFEADPSILSASSPVGGEPTEKLEQVGAGALEGVTSAGLPIAGGMAGAKTGMLLGAPFGPVGVGVGGGAPNFPACIIC